MLNDGHNKSALTAFTQCDGQAKVDSLFQQNLIIFGIYGAVDEWKFTNGLNHLLDKQRSVGQLNAGPLLKLSFVSLAPAYQVRYVHFGKGRNVCRSLLGLNHMLA